MNGSTAYQTIVSHVFHLGNYSTHHSCLVRWDPSRENDLFFNQSAILYAQYYQTQIFIHRPFIPKPGKPSPLSFPSLAICANAARSCSHIVDLQRRRESHVLYLNATSALCAGIVLLVNIWGAKQAGVRFDVAKERADVRKCLEAISACETRLVPINLLIGGP